MNARLLLLLLLLSRLLSDAAKSRLKPLLSLLRMDRSLNPLGYRANQNSASC